MSTRNGRLGRILSVATAACVVTGSMLVGGSAASAASAPAGRQAFPNSLPTFVSPSADAGAATDADVEGEIYLPLKDEAGAQKFALDVSTPGTAQYGHFLTPAQWIAKYSPSQSDFDAVKAYLVAQGQKIYATPASRLYIVFRGAAATVGPAFGTSLHNYRVSGKVVSAPSAAPSLPASIASKVAGLELGNARAKFTVPANVKQSDSAGTASLKTAAKSAAKASGARSAAAAAEPDCSDYWGQYTVTVPLAYRQTTAPKRPCGYVPSQLRASSGVNRFINAGTNGAGQTVAIVDAYASPSIVADTNFYMQQVGEPLLTNFSQIKPAKFEDEALCQEPSGWQAEEAIDVQSAHTIAPGAKILYVGGFNCLGGLDIAVSKILDSKLSTIVSNSYGDFEADYSDANVLGAQHIAAQAAGEGIGLYYSSGDDGDFTPIGVPFPDSGFVSSFATSVGGTSEGIDAEGKLVVNTGWGTTYDQIVKGAYASPLPGAFLFGAGGGRSHVLAQPAYQAGIVPAALSHSADGPMRVQPDVADLADPETGFQIAISPITDDHTLKTGPLEYDTYGGTSLASPLFAAKVALAQAISGKTVGFANPLLYKASKSGVNTDILKNWPSAIEYHKSTVTGNEFLFVFDKDTSLHTTKGYDDVTGLGEFQVSKLAAYLSGH